MSARGCARACRATTGELVEQPSVSWAPGAERLVGLEQGRPRIPAASASVGTGRRRRASRQVRRRRTAVVAGLAVIGLVVAVATSGGTRAPRPGSGRSGHLGGGSAGADSLVRATEAPWSLSAPLAREGAVALSGADVVLLGGLTAADTSSSAVTLVHLASGSETTVGTLVAPTHDAGVARLGDQVLVVGGGQASSVATVQGVPLPAALETSAGTPADRTGGASVAPPGPASMTARVVGSLPQARSDDTAVTVGGAVAVVGGYSGAGADPQVLVTTTGQRFAVAATLPVPVRYAAAVAVGDVVLVFGGEAAAGPGTGQPVDVIQQVNLGTGAARIVGHLPAPLEGAAAVDLAGHILVVGGVSPAGGVTSTSGAGGALQTSAAILAFDPATDTTTAVGTLPVPVAYTAVAVTGAAAWLLGGETNGVVVAAVQRVSLVSSAPRG